MPRCLESVAKPTYVAVVAGYDAEGLCPLIVGKPGTGRNCASQPEGEAPLPSQHPPRRCSGCREPVAVSPLEAAGARPIASRRLSRRKHSARSEKNAKGGCGEIRAGLGTSCGETEPLRAGRFNPVALEPSPPIFSAHGTPALPQDERARQRLRRGRRARRAVRRSSGRRGARHRRPPARRRLRPADRHRAPRDAGADAFMRIRNADGGEVEACGNGDPLRRLAADGTRPARTASHRDRRPGLLDGRTAGRRPVTVDMGAAAPRLARDPAGARLRHAACAARRRAALPIPPAPAWAIRTRSSSSPNAEAVDLARARPDDSSTTRCSPSAPMSASPQIARPRPHPPAGLGARRRHDPGLRHRRLRRPGRRPPPRPGRAHGESCSTAAS